MILFKTVKSANTTLTNATFNDQLITRLYTIAKQGLPRTNKTIL